MNHIDEKTQIQRRFQSLEWALDERMRRLWAAAEANAVGYGGVSLVSKATGISHRVIRQGKKELENKSSPSQIANTRRIRKEGGGRKKTVIKDPTIIRDLETLLEPYSRGDPMSPLRWTSKSVRKLADELINMGHKTNHQSVSDLLRQLGYSLKSNRKRYEGKSHPDRDAQFKHISNKVETQISSGNPAISVDSKKKEQIGNFKNCGREWLPNGIFEDVNIYDFPTLADGKVIPSGLYDIYKNQGWVSVGVDHDTGSFAVETIRRWWNCMGCKLYPNATSLLITADSGGSNGNRSRLWKIELQKLSNELGFPISVYHFPPGTSKWNKIEHRLFSFITKNWRGKPLISYSVIINLIAGTTTKTGLKVHCELDGNTYPIGIKISNNEIKRINMKHDVFHPEWNYTICPKPQS
jgi:transposase